MRQTFLAKPKNSAAAPMQDMTQEEKGSTWKGERDGNPDIEEAIADGAKLYIVLKRFLWTLTHPHSAGKDEQPSYSQG